jgi:hypothetical protein
MPTAPSATRAERAVISQFAAWRNRIRDSQPIDSMKPIFSSHEHSSASVDMTRKR